MHSKLADSAGRVARMADFLGDQHHHENLATDVPAYYAHDDSLYVNHFALVFAFDYAVGVHHSSWELDHGSAADWD